MKNEKTIDIEVDDIHFMSTGRYYENDNRSIAHAIKDGDPSAIQIAADRMSKLLPSNAVLCPVPGRKGFPDQTRQLARAISELTGAPVICALYGIERESNYDAKQKGRPLLPVDMGFQQVRDLPKGKIPIIIDNVVDTGTTAKAAVEALHGGTVLSLAMSDTLLQEKNLSSVEEIDLLFTIERDNAEIYLAGKTVKIDLDTAMYMLHQRDTMPEGIEWDADFPSIENHTSATKARHHPDFEAAKHGDFNAAIRLIDDLVKDEKILSIADQYPDATIAYIHSLENVSVNMIPAAYAAKFEAAGMKVEHGIYAITNATHTHATDISRISKRMRFEGAVTKGEKYILLDDFITSGAELRDFRDFVISKGGNVVMMTTLGHGSYGKLSQIGIDENYKQKLYESGLQDQDLQKYGIASSVGCLTLGEAAKLSRVVNAGRKEKTGTVSNGLQFLRQRNTTISEMENQFQECEEKNEKPEQTIRRSGFRR